jgi:hypothetical protein
MVNCSRIFSTLACVAVVITLHPYPAAAADSASPNVGDRRCQGQDPNAGYLR